MQFISTIILFIILTNTASRLIRVNVDNINFYEDAINSDYNEKTKIYLDSGLVIPVMETPSDIDLILSDPLSVRKVIERPKA
jgi:hypothetical protein